MIRSSKISLKFTNKEKLNQLKSFITAYKQAVSDYIDLLWDRPYPLKSLITKEDQNSINSTLSARALQAAGKQAIGIINGTKAKQQRRLYIIDKLRSEGKFKKARKLLRVYEETSISKPSLKEVNPCLDSRFTKIDLEENNTSFDGWVTISSIGNKQKIEIPFNKHKHFNKLASRGALKQSITISNNDITVFFEIADKPTIDQGLTLGLDIGQNTTISLSNGQIIDKDIHQHDYKTICEKLARKQKDSKAFKRTQTHRTNYINWAVNQMKLNGVYQVNRESIKHLFKGRRLRRKLKHWNYAELIDRVDKKLEDLGVQVTTLNPTYTSQRCYNCGYVRKSNRKTSKLFKCKACGHTTDADLNASKNLSLCLRPIGTKERLQGKNRTGFYWMPVGQELIVPATSKLNVL
jgi:transposase